MASSSGGRQRKGIDFSSMKQPTLIKQLRGILAEYPDGGQILKELIQNAEDAGASEVKILYDRRHINDKTRKTTPSYTKFFKGPALCIYNDAVFTETDWNGIRMIYSSVKEDDPLKVGRFGLGFKSVFHITDYPCIISGDKVLLIDPQQSPDKVNAMIDLCTINDLQQDGLDSHALWTALEGTFKLTRKVVKNRHYPGTIFWFPLREKMSEISDTLYDEAKVKDLLDSVQSEASSMLMFLTNLETISVYTRSNVKQMKEMAKVEIMDIVGTVKNKRKQFQKEIKSLPSGYNENDIKCNYKMAVRATIEEQSEVTNWLVVNYFAGGTAIPEFRNLMQDRTLGYSPVVGVARPLDKHLETFEGHVFCSLPLPREGSGLTGLPIHVNGYFALSQNRHHLKCETQEQHGKKINDKSILWNKYLISEALPKAYMVLVQATIEMSKSDGNTSELVKTVYTCLPICTKTRRNWAVLEKGLYNILQYTNCMYCKSKEMWIPFNNAYFATFSNACHMLDNDIQTSVIACLNVTGLKYVEIPANLFNTVKHYVPSVEDLNPAILASQLRRNSNYKKMSNLDKLGVLAYLFSDETNYNKVYRLELLPVVSGNSKEFDPNGEPVYACSSEEIAILQGHEENLITDRSILGVNLCRHLDHVCRKGLFQLRKLNKETIRSLIDITGHTMYQSSQLATWLKAVWRYIFDKQYIELFRDTRLFPILRMETTHIDLVKLSDRLLVKSCNSEVLPDGVCRCFEYMGVTVIERLPNWIPQKNVKSHLFWPSQKSIVALLSRIGSADNAPQTVLDFNNKSKRDDKMNIRLYLEKCSHMLSDEAMQFIKELQIFHAIRSRKNSDTDASVSETDCFVETDDFPDNVPLPFTCLSAQTKSTETLMERLGARRVDLQELVLATLKRFKTKNSKSPDLTIFMEYFMNSFHLFKTNTQIISSASDVPFVKAGTRLHKPSNLFDPSDSHLLNLLQGESLMPETSKGFNDDTIHVLKTLGLKNLQNVDADIALQIARSIDGLSKERRFHGKNMMKKADEFMLLIQSRPKLLNDICLDGVSLGDCLKCLSFMPVQNRRVLGYPECIQWFSHTSALCKPSDAIAIKQCYLVGAVMPTVDIPSDKINAFFGLKTSPKLTDVIKQLEIIRECYTSCHRAYIMPLIKEIYDYLAEQNDQVQQNIHWLAKKELILAGDGFVTGNRITISQEDKLDLSPYLYILPREFITNEDLFTTIGCRPRQNAQVLQDTLQDINIAHCMPQTKKIVRRDRDIVCNILKEIAYIVKRQNITIDESKLLIMVHCENKNVLKLLPVSKCVYDDDPACFHGEEEKVHLVHEKLSIHTVETLGVKSISRKALLDAEEIGVEEWGQNEKLTTRIKSLLSEGYTDGVSVPKELIQNADDAGATTVKFLYDERQNNDARKRVLTKGMKSFQGPALWIFNDSQFTQEDLQNITKLNAGTKEKDARKIGKFGLGFCSVYNLTDIPSFVSGKHIVFFDPHEEHLGNILPRRGKGLKYTLPNKTLVTRYIDQFKPYNDIFGCDVAGDTFSEYNGTLFRLPLRTEQQASKSLISSVAYTKAEMHKLLRMFIETAGNFLLFSQNVKSVEIYHLPANATNRSDQKLLYSIQKNNHRLQQGQLTPVTESVLSRIPDLIAENASFSEIHQSDFHQRLPSYTKRVFQDIADITKTGQMTWIISWAKGNGQSLSIHKDLASEGSIPICAIAVPYMKGMKLNTFQMNRVLPGFYRVGHVFCFLPLPLETDLPVHINGAFAVTSNRRQLASLTEDDKYSKQNAWNVALMKDALVLAHVQLLQALIESNMFDQNCKYHDLWPLTCASLASPFKTAFYRYIIVTNAKVFKGIKSWVGFEDVTFLDPKISHSAIGQLSFELLTHYPHREGKTLIEMPKGILDNIKINNENNRSRIEAALIGECELFLLFLRTLSDPFWNNRLADRNTLILAALKMNNDMVKKELKETRCIPTAPTQITLMFASDLVHPTSCLASLFNANEDRFPLDTTAFRNTDVLQRITELGMNTTSLPMELLIERCESIPKLANSRHCCALERSRNLFKYLCNKEIIRSIEQHNLVLEKIMGICMLPVMQKPKLWPFSWKAESTSSHLQHFNGNPKCKRCHINTCMSLVLGQSKCLFRQNVKQYVGMVSYVLDENVLDIRSEGCERLCRLIGIKDEETLPLKLVVEQIQRFPTEYKSLSPQLNEARKIYDNLFAYLENLVCGNFDDPSQELDRLRSSAIILIGDEFIRPSNIALHVKEECKPHLYRLPVHDTLTKKTIYTYLGVKETFNIDDIVSAMDTMNQKMNPNSSVETASHLLINLQDSMQKHNITYEAIACKHDRIIAPDIHCAFWPTYKLVAENEDFETNSSMNILHAAIAPQLGMTLGVKAKELRCFEDIAVGIPFGQRERLVTRIKGLLNAYPCDTGIMKELLQNADDAGATEIHFVKDYRYHSTERLFRSSCEPLQGPSLCVYNNSYFTPEDIEGIHNLGEGSKHDDPTKTGQYGVGFNAVYHLTDTPSLLTKGPGIQHGGRIIILDPLCKHVPKATVLEPGMMFNVDDLKTNFSDQLVGFSIDNMIKGDVGTVFRFPLRKHRSEISNEEIDTKTMNAILKSFEDDMFETVLFLKSVSCIKISNITSGSLKEEYTVNVKLSKEAKMKREHFNKTVSENTKANKVHKDKILNQAPVESIYQISVTDSRGFSRQWIIVQRFGMDENTEHLDELKHCFRNGDLGLLPIGGVAIPLLGSFWTESCKQKRVPQKILQKYTHCMDQNSTPKFQGRAFCFLPLPLKTGLPVHINAHFALDHEARRELWNEGYRQTWNDCLTDAIIIPSWISGLLHIGKLIQTRIDITFEWNTVVDMLDHYHSYFPLQESISASRWERMITIFYRHTVEQKIPLFPYVVDRKSGIAPPDGTFTGTNKRFRVLWTFVENTNELSHSGIFNNITSHISDTHVLKDTLEGDSLLIKTLLLSFRMKLLDTPICIREAMNNTGLSEIPTASPSLVISFLRTYNDPSDCRCDVGPINRPISATKFLTVDNLNVLLKYIVIDHQLHKHMEGLPVLLTSDNILKACSREAPVFMSSYSPLLPGSASKFMHESIRQTLWHNRLFQTPIFKRFMFEDFVQMLPCSFPESTYASGNEIVMGVTTITKEWLCLFYDFLHTHSHQNSRNDSQYTQAQIDVDTLKKRIGTLAKWSLLPCIKECAEHSLAPFCECMHLLYLDNDDPQDNLSKSLRQFNLPKLDMNVFNKCKYVNDIKSSMSRCVASLDKPYELLLCLVHYCYKIKACIRMTNDDAIEILAYFGRHITELAKQSDEHLLCQALRKLPLYPTQQGTLCAIITGNQEVLVLPEGMPRDGMQQWSNACNITLLQKHNSLKSLYAFLGLEQQDIEFLYGEKILPTFNELPKGHWMTHIIYLKDEFIKAKSSTDKQKRIIQELKGIAFVQCDGVMKRADELFDRKNEVFEHMMDPGDFPPVNFRNKNWHYFLKMLGLICDINDYMLVQFAQQIANESDAGITEILRSKSRILFRWFTHNNHRIWKEHTLSQLKTVRFIEPYIMQGEEIRIWPQLATSDKLVCFNEAISCTQSILCWTSVNLLKEELQKLRESDRKQLGIHEVPPIDKVILHCQNVCDSLKSKMDLISKKFVQRQMTCFYEFFDCKRPGTSVMARLKSTPFVHLPEENDVVTSSEVIIGLDSGMEIKPFLFKAPMFYGKYHDLFAFMGSKNRIMFRHYTDILQALKVKCKGNQMIPVEQGIAQKVLRGLIGIETVEDESIKDVMSVFLLNTDLVFVDSKRIVISDNDGYKERLQRNVQLDLFAGGPFLDVPGYCPEKIFTKWPSHLKPRLLTDIVAEVVQIGDGTEQQLTHSVKAKVIEEFLHSEELVNALCRMLKHQFFRGPKKLKYDDKYFEENIRESLQNISVVEMRNLRTVLMYLENPVNGSEIDVPYYINRVDRGQLASTYTFYFKSFSDTCMTYTSGLIKLIRDYVISLDPESVNCLFSVLHFIETPQEISRVLDSLNIDQQHNLQTIKCDYFPSPGTYVEEKFIPFLEQSILPFHDYEYSHVAMELQDTTVEINDDAKQIPIYIYVTIIDEVSIANITCNLRRKYVVNTGSAELLPEEVPIYRLYRFARKEEDPGNELQRYDKEQIQSKPFDEHCRRIREDLKEAWILLEIDRKRIIRRLLFKWHPDKNPGNKEYCTNIFQYIKIVISRLENQEVVEDNVNDEMSRGPSNISPSSSEYYDNVCRRAGKIARAYYDNFDHYNRKERTGPYLHSQAARIKCPDQTEAKRWMRQAKNDFLAAGALMREVDHADCYNWICYTCHQASEKALKSVRYSQDANNVPRGSYSHNLMTLTSQPDLQEQAKLLEERLGNHARLRYPDAASRPKIPSDMFDKEDAEFTINVAKRIIELAEERIS